MGRIECDDETSVEKIDEIFKCQMSQRGNLMKHENIFRMRKNCYSVAYVLTKSVVGCMVNVGNIMGRFR